MRCTNCGGELHRVQDWNPSTKKLEKSYHYTHIYGLGKIITSKSLCTNVISVKQNTAQENEKHDD